MDIAKCENKECPSSDNCLRYLVIPNEFSQVYVEFKPHNGEERCIYFIDYDKARADFRNIPPR